MSSNKTRHSIRVYEPTTTKETTYGSEDLSYSYAFNVRAEIKYVPGKELLQNQTETASTAATLKMRYREEITEKYRFYFDAAFWNIKSLEPDHIKRWVNITITKILN